MKDYGTVKYNSKAYYLMQDAYYDGHDCYKALARDASDKMYAIYWDITNPDAEWEDEMCEWNDVAAIEYLPYLTREEVADLDEGN